MKLTTFILIIALSQVSAKGFGQRISLDESNVPLEKILKSIMKQSGFNFIYNTDEIKGLTVSVKMTTFSVIEAVKESIKNLPLTFNVVKNHIVLRSVPLMIKNEKVQVQLRDSIRVSGKVIDSLGVPISGARIFVVKAPGVKSTNTLNTTTVTQNDGSFNLIANVGDLLTIVGIGYKDAVIIVREKMTFQKIVLKIAIINLNEVSIQTGYQKLSKERATGSYSKPDMKTLASRTGTLDLISRLDGQIPGLSISPNTFEISTNGDGMISQRGRSLIRGSSSVFLPTEPLYVVNGVIVPDFRALNLDDVDDVTVLKDAAAAAIWGAQAANGVIVITTKSGMRNTRLKISYSGSLALRGKPDLDYQRFLNSKEYINVAKQIFDPTKFAYSTLNNSSVAPHDEILYDQYAKYGKKDVFDEQGLFSLDSLSAIDNRKQIKDLFYRNEITNNHSLSISGGNDVYNFYSSFGYTNVIDKMPGNVNNTYRFNLSQSMNLGSRIKLSLNAGLLHFMSKGRGQNSVSNSFLPYQLFKDTNGNSINMPYIQGRTPEQRNLYQSLSRIDLNTYNIFDDLNNVSFSNKNLTANLTADMTVKLWKGLSFAGTYGYLTSPGTSTNYEDHRTYSMRNQLLDFTQAGEGNSGPTYLIPDYGGNYNTKNMNQRNWTVRNQLVYNYSGRDGNDLITLQAGHEARESFTNANATNLMGYDRDLQTYAILDYKTLSDGYYDTITGFGALSQQQFDISEATSRFNSYYALASYTFNHKYSIDGSWRVDHSNLFGSDVSAQNKPVWSAGGRWNMSKENFMKSITWLNSLSLRATYGITGNSPYVGAATTYDILRQEQFLPYPLTGGASYVIESPANNKLNWETTQTTNLGLDFSVLQNKVSGSIEYYHKNTTNLLGNVRLNPIVGFNSGLVNIGKLRNEGINLSLYSTNINTKNIRWSTSFILSYNKNKLLEYVPPSSDNAAQRISSSRAVGYPLNSVFAYNYAGLDNKGYPQIRLADGTITTNPQAAKQKDLVYMGSRIPVYNGGFSNTFQYKQFELNLNMVYSMGAVMKRDVNNFWSGRLPVRQGNFTGNISPDFLDRWQKPGDESFTVIPGYLSVEDSRNRNTLYYTLADINVVSASYIKMRDIMLSYTLSPKALSLLKIESLTLRAQMNNILIWKANKYGIDPEYQDFTNGNRGIPNEHTFNFGINIKF